jgi:hypothetical protein
MGETTNSQEIRAVIGARKTTRCYRNNTGALRAPNGELVHFGLFIGSGDLICIETVTITPEMVGTQVGVFCSVEVKRDGPDKTPAARKKSQKMWRDVINGRGGRAGIARTPEEAIKIIEGRATDDQK